MSYRVDYIGATWCKVCVVVKPEIEKLAKNYDIAIKLMDVDDDNIEDIKKVPTVRLYKDDVLVKEFVTEHVKSLNTELALTKKVTLDEDF
jgi:thiol-disulfide isomerase/thioredoxin